jgi:lipoyl(octanoyl) transferase
MHAQKSSHASSLLEVHDLGRLSYGDAYERQRALQEEVLAGRHVEGTPMGHLLLLEHDPPVITISRRPEARSHLVAGPELLRSHGIEVAETDRGGDITYHGPGQLVAYVIIDLNRLGLNLRSFMRWLEQIVIDTAARFGVVGHRDHCATGVWVTTGETSGPSEASEGESTACGMGGDAKLCAMGVRVSRWVSMHGLALNVHPNMDHFGLIVPCGLAGRRVTSMHELLGDASPTMEQVKETLAFEFRRAMPAESA